MDTQHCSAHSDQNAIAYCIKDKVLYCVECFDEHDKHNHTSIGIFKSAQNTYGQAALLQETSTLLAKHKIVATSLFNAAEAYLSEQKKALMNSLPEMLKQTVFKNFENSKKLESEFIVEATKVLSIIDKFAETNINAIMNVVWYNDNEATRQSKLLKGN